MEDFDGEDHRKQNTTEAAVDSLSPLPVEVIYQIMEHLTLRDAARMSVLSRSWRKIWLSLPCIVFDHHFFWFLRNGSVGRRSDRSVYSIMHRILLLHEGPIVKFTVYVDFADGDMISPWLSYISKSVRELTVWANFKASSSHVLFSCSKLRKLSLHGGTISIPPTFTGFTNLVALELDGIEALGDAVFGSLIHTASQLEKLVLHYCRGFGDIVIDFPLLRTLEISGTWKSICFKNAPNLKVAKLDKLCVEGLGYEKVLTQFIGSLVCMSSLLEELRLPEKGFEDIVLDSPLLRTLEISESWQSICFKNVPNLTTFILWGQYVEDLDYEKALNLINFLTSSRTIETLALISTFCEKFFLKDDAGEKVFTLDHVKHLTLFVINRQNSNGFSYVTSMMRTCPNMTHLHLALVIGEFELSLHRPQSGVFIIIIIIIIQSDNNLTFQGESSEEDEIFESDHNCTLDHLRRIYISGFEGSRVDLKWIEFLLKSSPQLVKLAIVKHYDPEQERKIQEELMMFPRASSEAEVIVVDEVDEFLVEKIWPN